MLHAFVSARAGRPGRRDFGGLSASVATHAGIVVVAIVLTSHPIQSRRIPVTIGVEHVVFTGITPTEPVRVATAPGNVPHRTRRAVPRSRGTAHVSRAPRIEDAEYEFLVARVAAAIDAIDIDLTALTDIDLATRASDGIEFDRAMIAQLTSRLKPLERGSNGAYAESMVEKVVAPFGSNPRPHYPSALQAGNVEGSFVVKFVVDSTGRVDRGSFVFPTQVHRLFVKSVRDALTRSRYIPAELAGRRVAQLVQQRFSFILER